MNNRKKCCSTNPVSSGHRHEHEHDEGDSCCGHDHDCGHCSHESDEANSPDTAALDNRHERGYDRPLIDGDDDECACSCSHHPEDEKSKEIVTLMVFQLDEVIALSSGPVYGEFIANVSLQQRLIDLLQKVEDESKSLPDDFKQRKPKVDWSFLRTMSEQITHPVLGMNPETLWDVVRLEIPHQNKMLGIVINGCSHEH